MVLMMAELSAYHLCLTWGSVRILLSAPTFARPHLQLPALHVFPTLKFTSYAVNLLERLVS